MTPFELKVLLHHHISPEPLDPTSDLALEIGEAFIEKGLLEKTVYGHFRATEKGKFFVNYILNTPFPIARYVIPKQDEEWLND